MSVGLAAADLATGDARHPPGSLSAKRVTSFLLGFTTTEEQQRYEAMEGIIHVLPLTDQFKSHLIRVIPRCGWS